MRKLIGKDKDDATALLAAFIKGCYSADDILVYAAKLLVQYELKCIETADEFTILIGEEGGDSKDSEVSNSNFTT